MPLIRKEVEPPDPALPGPEADAAIASLRDDDAQERWMAARKLALPEAVPALARALREEGDPRVREAILTSLARIGSAESLEAVLPHLRAQDAGRRGAALDALRAMPGSVRPRLPALLRDADSGIRLLACELARGLPPAEATGLLVPLLDADPEVNVCAAAADVLAETGTAEALPALARCAERFADQPFLRFAIRAAATRIAGHG